MPVGDHIGPLASPGEGQLGSLMSLPSGIGPLPSVNVDRPHPEPALAVMTHSLHWLDHAVILAYLGISLGLGFAMRKQSSREEFFSAGRSMGRLTVGLSVMATLFSANSFAMYPSVAYGDSLRVAMVLVAFWAMSPLVVWVFIPVYSRLNCRTAYEYLEMRFHVSVRSLASGLFVLLRVAWMASATSAAAVAISGITGVDQISIIMSLGAVSIAYTMLGGLRAVMWTDVLQFFVFAGTILFATGLLIAEFDGGIAAIMQTCVADRPNVFIDMSLEPTLRFGTVAVLVGSFLEGLSAFGADQVAVQRYISAKDVRTSQIGYGINLLGMLIVIPGLLLIGTCLYGYFNQHPEHLAPVVVKAEVAELASQAPDPSLPVAQEQVAAIEQHYREHPGEVRPAILARGLQDQALPQFVRLKFPAGVVGLLVAALMAATMSSIDSGIHSVTTAVVVDFRDRLLPHLRPTTDAREMRAARLLVLAIGILSVVLACFVGELGDVFAVAKKTTSAFGGPLLAVFILGLFVRHATSVGVFIGTLAGAAVTLAAIYWYPSWFSLWFWPLGFSVSVALSLVISLVPGSRRPPAGTELTFRHVMRSLPATATGSDD